VTSYRNNNLVVDATLVAVNNSRIQKENKYHSEHRRKQIGYNNNREPQPLDNTPDCQVTMTTGNVRGGKNHTNHSIVEAKDKSVFNSVGFLIVSY
jgi:hypothetical protein